MRLSAGQPTLPYPEEVMQANQTLRIDVTSLDFDDVLEAPTALTYRIDNLTDAINLVPETNIPTPGTETTLTISAAVNVMTRQYRDSQLNQVVFTATYADGSSVQKVVPYQLNAVYSVQGPAP